MSDRRIGIYFLDVGQGDASIIFPPRGEGDPIVFDCRDDLVVARVLTQWRVTALHAVVASHLDWDHIAGMRQFLKNTPLQVNRVLVPVDRDISDKHPRARTAKELVDYVQEEREKSRWELIPPIRDPRPLLDGKDWKIEIVAPDYALELGEERSGRRADANEHSAVLRVQMGENTVLIGADAPLSSWARIPAAQVKAHAFRIPHHGGALDDGGIPAGWDVDHLYASVGADEAVVSVGTNNDNDHPVEAWVAPIARGRCSMQCTQVTPHCQADVRDQEEQHRADVLLLTNRVEPAWRHLRDARRPMPQPRTIRTGVPCAGTVFVELREDGTRRVRPSTEAHDRVVRLWGTPLCRPTVEGVDQVSDAD